MTTPFAPRPYRFSRQTYHHLGNLGLFADQRVELIRGEIVQMSPINWPHSLSVSLVQDALRRVFQSNFWVQSQSPIVSETSEPQPDAAVHSGSIRDLHDHPTSAMLVVEVADSSLFFDTTAKAELYAEMKIPEYWVLDLEHRQLLVFRDPAPLAAGGHAFQTHLSLKETDSISPLAAPHATIRIAELLP